MFGGGDTEPVVIVHPPDTDPFGDPIPGTGGETTVDDCLFAPGASRELLDNANQVRADGTVFAPPGTRVDAHDQVRIRGLLHDIAGTPREWLNAVIEIPVRRTTG
jgi:hypothetical protein